jgi:ERCC4-type nuclease
MIEIDDRGDCTKAAAAQLPKYLPHKTCVEVKRLVHGDVEWDGKDARVYVELKRADDLVQSLLSGHMQDQEARMLELDGDKYVVVVGEILADSRGGTLTNPRTDPLIDVGSPEGKWYKYSFTESHEMTDHRFPYSGVMNYLSRLQELGIGVVWVGKESDLGLALFGMYNRSLKVKSSMVARTVSKKLDPQVQAVMVMYPGLRMQAAESLVERYGPFRIVPKGVDYKQLMKLPGLGKTSAKKIADG